MGSQNDHHIVSETDDAGKTTVRLETGTLGADEPKEIPKRTDLVRAALARESEALVERERELLEREAALNERERLIEERAEAKRAAADNDED